MTIVDDFSRAVWTFLLLAKYEVKQVLLQFFAYTEKQFNKSVKMVRSDNGTEFMVMSSYFRENGIVHQTSCVATPQQNGRVERKRRHILNVARTIMFQASMPIKFWGEAVLTAAYLINQTPSSIHKGKSPYEILHGVTPDYKQLRVFGSECHVHRASRDKDKFGARSRACVFVGFPFGKKGWKVYDIEKNEFLVSRDVVFREDTFPFAAKTIGSQESVSQLEEFDEDWLITPVDRGSNQATGDIDEHAPPVLEEVSAAEVLAPQEPSATPEVLPQENLGRGCREKKQSVRLKDFVAYNAALVDPDTHHTLYVCSHQSSMPALPGTSLYLLSDFVSDDQFSPGHKGYLTALTTASEPKNYKEAVVQKVFRDSMITEVEALEDQHTWDITDLPPDKTALGSQWVYKIKYNADGTILRYKSRVVVQGNKQVEGEDYSETFAPVVKMNTVRTLLRLVAAKQWEVYQMDVNNAFLHGDLEEEVYMKLPPGFRHKFPGKVCRLRKLLYGLKQAPHYWFKKLSDALLRFGLVQSYEDYSLFSYTRGNIELRVLIYVDDLLICGSDAYMLQKFKDYLSRCFSMKDLGKLKYFLGIEVCRGSEGIFYYKENTL